MRLSDSFFILSRAGESGTAYAPLYVHWFRVDKPRHTSKPEIPDAYKEFLSRGQGTQLLTWRTSLGLSRKEFAERFSIPPDYIRLWETERKRISRRSWEKYSVIKQFAILC